MEKFKLDYNSTYISSNLIDELDFVIGEYGRPNITFIYTLNAFLESYILNSTFYLSEQEFKHLQLLSKSIFPNGRPILEILSKNKSFKIITGIGNNIGTVVGILKTDLSNPISYQEKINEFLKNGLETEVAREKYLKISDLSSKKISLKFLSIGKVEDGIIALESENTPEKFFNDITKITYDSNVQSVLPYYSYNQQIIDNKQRVISNQIIKNLTSLFDSKQDGIRKHYGLIDQKIPPLVNILLNQCNTIEEIPQKIIELDHDFTDLRNSIIEYEKKLDEAKTIKEQIDAINDYNKFWNVFTKKYTDSKRFLFNFWELSDESDLEKSIDNAIDDESINNILEDLNIGKLVGKSAKKIIDYYKEKRIIKRFRGITDLWNLFNNSPNIKENIKNYERIFKVKIDSSELKQLQNKNEFSQ